ncbi:hypothetical protein [Micromonospora sp. NPDC049891]|uniref:hypothetical protein n=1 Tax=Micromonospora sp. NPDC049891 TaxID=3155655 RepID=UPI003407E631
MNAAAIRTATNPDTVRATLMKLTVPQINAVAADLDITVTGTKTQRADTITFFAVELPRSRAAIQRGGR